MIDLFETAKQLQVFCDKQGWRSCFIGGIAVQRWGEPRVTRDVDLTLLALVGHATPFSIGPGIEIRTCSAEDLIVLKLFASRPLDIHDAEGVAIRQKSWLDWEYIEAQLRPLAEVKDQPEILQSLARLREL